MKNALFITGTDTAVGKTHVSSLLLQGFSSMGLRTIGLKPIASGCKISDKKRLINDDAVQLQQYASIKIAYKTVNPIALMPPIAPHIAAKQAKIPLDKMIVKNHILQSRNTNCDMHIIEGAGGWHVPLNDNELYSDAIVELNIPVIAVIGIKLGCLNHSILTINAINNSGASLVGWVANCIDNNMLALQENIDTLKQWIAEPCLGIIPYGSKDTGFTSTVWHHLKKKPAACDRQHVKQCAHAH